MVDLTRFEIGYDRDYVGAMLHCFDCSDDPFESGHVIDLEVDGVTLAAIVEAAEAHQMTVHGVAEEAVLEESYEIAESDPAWPAVPDVADLAPFPVLRDAALLFAGEDYYPHGGWNDLQACGTLTEVLAAWEAHRWCEAVYADAERAWNKRYPGGQWVHPDANEDYQQLHRDHPYSRSFDWAHVVVQELVVLRWDGHVWTSVLDD